MDGRIQAFAVIKDAANPSEPLDDLTDRTPVIGVDLFAGAGGFSRAAINAKISIAAAVEMDAHACRTYRRNFILGEPSDPHLFEADIRSLKPEKVVAQVPMLTEHGCDLLIGGPPCQGFSAHRLNDAGVGDPRNELLIRYFDFVTSLRPRAFLVENVPGLLWPRHADYLSRFKKLADDFGYDLKGPVKLNACWYGVPQNRNRVFMLGIRRSAGMEISWPPASTHRPIGSPDDGRPEWVTAGAAFETDLSASDPNAVHMKHSAHLTAYFAKLPEKGGSRSDVKDRVLPCHKNHSGHSDVYGRIDPARPGPTMTTACVNPSKGRFVHPTEPHGITLRHAARLQTFPDSFFFEGGLMAGGVQVGNAVPVLMGEKLLAPVAEAIRAAKAKDRAS